MLQFFTFKRNILFFVVISLQVQGKSNTNERVVGGTDVKPHSAPFIVHLDAYYGFFCGGSLIDMEWVISAGHCHFDPNTFTVVVGDHDLNNYEGTEQVLSVELAMQHPLYNDYDQTYDFMMIKLKTKAILNDYVQPAVIPTIPIVEPTLCTVYGWGYVSGISSNLPGTLQSTQVRTVSNTECNESYQIITEDMICAGSVGKDACNGDSGGPLICNNKLHGVVSWGYGCAFPEYPGVYSRVTSVTDWINYLKTYY